MRAPALLFVLLLGATGLSASAEEVPVVVETLPTVTVEGKLPRTAPPKNAMVQVSAGAGRKELDPPRNELGIELKSMERFEELSLERRLDKWWLEPEGLSTNWQSQVRADFSLDQKWRARSVGRVFGARTQVEGGYWQDRRDLVLLVNDVNPYDSTYDRRQTVSNQNDRSYLAVAVDGSGWQSLAELDTRREDVHAGVILAGEKATAQESFSGRWQNGRLQLLPFAQTRQSRFDSKVSRWLTTETQSVRTGLQSDFASRSDHYTLEATATYEALSRSFADETRGEFQRVTPAFTATKEFSTQRLDMTFNLGGETGFEQISGSKGADSAQNGVWNFAGELSSTKREAMGVAGRFRRFAILPTPTQRFGDGALLLGSGDLPSETGIRVAAGPWLKSEALEADLAIFYEHSENAPVVVAVSPSSAKTFAIGGVWARGLELHGLWRFGLWSIDAAYGYLEAFNDSEITWQRGKPVPGRPKHLFKTSFDYGKSGWKAGVGYGYRSEDALDLTGMWFSPPKHSLDVYVGYGAKTWEVRLAGGQLLAGLNSPPTGQFNGQASPDLLQPTIEQTEVRLQCEFLM